jgi:hypothetical protein
MITAKVASLMLFGTMSQLPHIALSMNKKEISQHKSGSQLAKLYPSIFDFFMPINDSYTSISFLKK